MNTINTETGEVTQRSIKAVAAKIAKAMAEMDTHAPKDGQNKFYNYNYTSVSQYMTHVRPALVKYGLVIIPSLISTQDYDDSITDVVMKYTIIDSETGEYLEATIQGRGQDVSRDGKRLDKGPYKAYSGAFKYFLSETFMIASGDDPDETPTQPAAKTKQQAAPKPAPPTKEANGNGGKPLDPMTRFWLEVKAAKLTREQGQTILTQANNDAGRAVDILNGMAQE